MSHRDAGAPPRAVLQQSILDVFDEYGVQSMTPAYEGDPEQPKVVPRDQWWTAPARPVLVRAAASRSIASICRQGSPSRSAGRVDRTGRQS